MILSPADDLLRHWNSRQSRRLQPLWAAAINQNTKRGIRSRATEETVYRGTSAATLSDARYAQSARSSPAVDQQCWRGSKPILRTPEFKSAVLWMPIMRAYTADPVFRAWADTPQRAPCGRGYATCSPSRVKAHWGHTRRCTSAQDAALMAELAQEFGHDELRISHDRT